MKWCLAGCVVIDWILKLEGSYSHWEPRVSRRNANVVVREMSASQWVVTEWSRPADAWARDRAILAFQLPILSSPRRNRRRSQSSCSANEYGSLIKKSVACLMHTKPIRNGSTDRQLSKKSFFPTPWWCPEFCKRNFNWWTLSLELFSCAKIPNIVATIS